MYIYKQDEKSQMSQTSSKQYICTVIQISELTPTNKTSTSGFNILQ